MPIAVKCPKCGGDPVSTTVTSVDERTGMILLERVCGKKHVWRGSTKAK